MVVGHFRVIHAAGIQIGHVERLSVFPEFRHGNHFSQQGRNVQHDILRDMAASRPRIRNKLLFIQGLGDGEGLLRCQVIMDVAIFLERGQVVQKRGLLESPLVFRPSDCRHRTGSDFPVCRLCRILFLELFRVDEHAVRVLPFQREVQLPVRGRDEIPVLLEAGTYHGERRGLYTSYGVVRRAGSYRQRAARVHAHQPVRLCPAVGGGIQAVVVAAVPEVRQTLADGLVGERGDPQAFERFGIA